MLAKKNLDVSRDVFELSQKDIEHRLASEAIRLSVDMCIRSAEHVHPLVDKADEIVMKHPFPPSRPGADRWDFGYYREKWSVGLFTYSKVQRVVQALNAMEAIVVPFAQGVADETVARDSIGAAFTMAASSYAYVIAACRSRDNSNAYPATRLLCDSWLHMGLSSAEDNGIPISRIIGVFANGAH